MDRALEFRIHFLGEPTSLRYHSLPDFGDPVFTIKTLSSPVSTYRWATFSQETLPNLRGIYSFHHSLVRTLTIREEIIIMNGALLVHCALCMTCFNRRLNFRIHFLGELRRLQQRSLPALAG